MLFEQGVYRIDVDLERTQQWYAAQSLSGIDDCNCAGCRNYRAAIGQFPREIREFLEKLGIDPAFPAEMTAYVSKNHVTYYQGFFHLCGTVQEGKEPFVQVAPKAFQVHPDYFLDLGGGCKAFFSNHIGLLREDFPRPVIQVELDLYLPWVLDEKDPYEY